MKEKIIGKSRAIYNSWKNKYFRVSPDWVNPYKRQAKEAKIVPFGYCYPEELFIGDLPDKVNLWAEVIPGLRETYRFHQESAYYQMYGEARFGFTWKKGGWDCLRHYEIIAHGSLPAFTDIEECPNGTLEHFPKKLLKKIKQELLPWKSTEASLEKYAEFWRELREHSMRHLTCEARGLQFLRDTGLPQDAKVLLLSCDMRTNYSREFAFIGLNRVLKNGGGQCLSFPRLDQVYEDYPEQEAQKLYGRGFGYSRRLEISQEESKGYWNESKILTSIEEKHWDFVLYGKVGVDEGPLGSLEGLPFWNQVQKNYDKGQIGFLYGGDHMHDLNDMGSIHTRHLVAHSKFGTCFVRELTV
ncbi:hypothetical protein [Algoriphagus namhaensis]